MVAQLCFYLDENVPVAVARQLHARGIDVVTVRDLGLRGEPDETHLSNAKRLGRVLCTYDADYLQLAATGTKHAGIVFGQQDTNYIGDWVNYLTLLHAIYTPQDMENQIEYL